MIPHCIYCQNLYECRNENTEFCEEWEQHVPDETNPDSRQMLIDGKPAC